MKEYKVTVDVDVDGDDEVKKLNKDLDKTKKATEDIKKESVKTKDGIKDSVNSMDGSFMGFIKTIGKSIKALGLLRGALLATGLGALLAAISAVKAAFEASEEGQNKFRMIMEAIKEVTGVLTDYLSDLGEKIIWAFENPRQALEDFWAALKANVVERVESLIDMFGYLGTAIKRVFEGDFSGALEAGKQAAKEFVDVQTGVANSVDKIAEGYEKVTDRIQGTIDKSTELSKLQNSIDKRERELIVSRAEREVELAEIREKLADKERVSAEDRIKLTEEAQRISESIYNDEIRIAQDRLRIQQERNALSKSDKDALEKEARLEAELIRLEAQRANSNKIFLAERTTAQREYNVLKKQELQEEQDLLDWEQEQFDADLEFFEKKADAELEIERKKITEKQSLYLEDAQNQKQAEMQKRAMIAATAQTSLALVGQMFSMLAEESADDFEKQKKYKIAGAVTQGLMGIVGAWAGAFMTPAPAPAQLILAGISTALMIGAMAANISKIKSTTPESAGGGSASVASSTPSFSMISPMTQGETNMNQSLNAEINPVKSYVLSGDVSNQQAMDRRIESQAVV